MAGGVAIRERIPGEPAPDSCDFGCLVDDGCFVERDTFDVGAESVARAWVLCGGLDRRVWPRAGGIDEQDSGFVALFAMLDTMVLNARLVKSEV